MIILFYFVNPLQLFHRSVTMCPVFMLVPFVERLALKPPDTAGWEKRENMCSDVLGFKQEVLVLKVRSFNLHNTRGYILLNSCWKGIR